MTPPIVVAELKLTVPEAAPLTILISPRLSPSPLYISEIKVSVDKVASRSAPTIFPSFLPRIPKFEAVLPPSTSLTDKEFVIKELVSVRVIPFPALFIDAVIFDIVLILVITLSIVIDDVILNLPVFPALSVIKILPD